MPNDESENKPKPTPEPTVVDKRPDVRELEPDTYLWCACGKSANQPFCDGSHEGTEFEPVEFTIKQKKRVPLCLCKHTKDAPYCDGAHCKL